MTAPAPLTATPARTATAVVTGIGVIAPTGTGTEAYWSATLDGRGAIAAIGRFDASGYPATLAGEVPGFAASEHLPGRLIPQTDRTTQMSLAATSWALADAEITPSELDEFGMGVVTAATAGGFEFGHYELEKLCGRGNKHVSAYQSIAWFYAVNTGQISIHNGMRGPSGVLVSDHAGGLDAVAHARRQIRKGSDLIVSGGVDGAVCSWGLVAQWAAGTLSESRDPSGAYLPFDLAASGYVPGEGGAILIVENAASAVRRRAPRIYGVIAGYASTFDPREGSGRAPGLRRAIELGLADAGIGPGDVDVVFADAFGTPELDRIEVDAIACVFAAYGVPVTAPKTMTGRLFGGGAALDIAAALLSIRDGVIPPTVNVDLAPGYPIDLVAGSARTATVRTALVLARGHRGFNSVAVIRSPEAIAA